MGDNLLSCPFCGGAASFGISTSGSTRGGHFIACGKCGASTNVRFATMDDPSPLLREQWNARIAQAPRDPNTERLRRALDNLVNAIEGGREAQIKAAAQRAEDLLCKLDGVDND